MNTQVDVVVVSYNSADRLRRCVETLTGLPDVAVVIVDNASTDGSLEAVSDLALTSIQVGWNSGFSHGCNVGIAVGAAPYVLLLNPDAAIDAESLGRLVAELDADPSVGLVAPKIVGSDGRLHHSLRRFPRLRSTYAQALFLHRVFPRALWADEVIRREESYARPVDAEWVSGACMLLRRSALEELAGLDERFFLFCEDTDLCLRLRRAGYRVRFQPEATAVHEGGASAPHAAIVPIAVESKIRYAQKHYGAAVVSLDRLGLGLGELTHMLLGRGGRRARAAHVEALRLVLRPARGH